MDTKDLYKTLEVKKGASQEDIRRSYRKLARKYHPDANRDDPNAEDRFKEIQHAYEVLSNPEKRREYDEGPRTYFGGAQQGAPRNTGNFSDLSDLFGGYGNLGDIFGQARQRTVTPEKGESATVNVNLKFRGCSERGYYAGQCAGRGRLQGLPGDRRRPWDCAQDLSGLWRPRHEEPRPGVFRFFGALSAVWGTGKNNREALCFLWW